MDLHFLGVGKPLLTVPRADLHVLINREDPKSPPQHLCLGAQEQKHRTHSPRPKVPGEERQQSLTVHPKLGAQGYRCPSQTLARLPFLHSFRRMTSAFLDPKGTRNKAARTNYIPSPLFGTFSRASQHTWSDSLRSRSCFLSLLLSLPVGVAPTTHPSHS